MNLAKQLQQSSCIGPRAARAPRPMAPSPWATRKSTLHHSSHIGPAFSEQKVVNSASKRISARKWRQPLLPTPPVNSQKSSAMSAQSKCPSSTGLLHYSALMFSLLTIVLFLLGPGAAAYPLYAQLPRVDIVFADRDSNNSLDICCRNRFVPNNLQSLLTLPDYCSTNPNRKNSRAQIALHLASTWATDQMVDASRCQLPCLLQEV